MSNTVTPTVMPTPIPTSGQSDTPRSWSAQLWRDSEDVFTEIVRHPFLTGLADGSLDPAVYAYYLVQDAHYLRDYARALAVVGAKAPRLEDTAMFADHASGVLTAEITLHNTELAELGIDAATVAATPVSPTTRAYTSYLLATCLGGSFAEGLAAVLPCYWIYARVGQALSVAGSPNPRYQGWIDLYAAPEFSSLVDDVLAVVDRVGAGLAAEERSRAQAHYDLVCRYEWMFWDAAWRREKWPLR